MSRRPRPLPPGYRDLKIDFLWGEVEGPPDLRGWAADLEAEGFDMREICFVLGIRPEPTKH